MWLYLMLMIALIWPTNVFAQTDYLCTIGGNANTTVKSSQELTNALKKAKAGDTIQVMGGNYNFKEPKAPEKNKLVKPTFTLAAKGTASKPITIKFDTKATLTNVVFLLAGEHARLVGGVWNNSQIMITGNSNRVTKAHFTAGKPGGNKSALSGAVEIIGGASYNRVDHNQVDNWQRRAFRNRKVDNSTKGNIFDYNYYIGEVKKEYIAKPPGNAGEAFQLGIGSHSPAPGNDIGTIVEHNLVDGFVNDHELVSIKALSVTIRNNTFLNAPGRVVDTRTSKNSKIIGNYLEDFNSGGHTGGIAIYGDDNQVVGNELKNASIVLYSGNAQLPEVQDRSKEGAHPTANNTAVAGNTVEQGKIILGAKSHGAKQKKFPKHYPVTKTCLYQNKGKISIADKNMVKGTTKDARCPGVGMVKTKPTKLTPDQVGLGAKQDAACQMAAKN